MWILLFFLDIYLNILLFPLDINLGVATLAIDADIVDCSGTLAAVQEDYDIV